MSNEKTVNLIFLILIMILNILLNKQPDLCNPSRMILNATDDSFTCCWPAQWTRWPSSSPPPGWTRNIPTATPSPSRSGTCAMHWRYFSINAVCVFFHASEFSNLKINKHVLSALPKICRYSMLYADLSLPLTCIPPPQVLEHWVYDVIFHTNLLPPTTFSTKLLSELEPSLDNPVMSGCLVFKSNWVTS